MRSVPQPSSGSRLVGIEGLRAMAMMAVLTFHGLLFSGDGQLQLRRGMGRARAGAREWAGPVFTLSAFLLYRPFAAAVVKGEPLPGFRRYGRNRALRVLPAYWVILAVVAAVGAFSLY